MERPELLDRDHVGQHNMTCMEHDPLREVTTDEVVLVSQATPVVRGQEQTGVLDSTSGEHHLQGTYDDALPASADPDDAFDVTTR